MVNRKAPNTAPAEWVAAALSAAMVLGVIAFLVYDGLRSPPMAPVVTVQVDSIFRAGNGHLVQLRAVNRSRRTAAEVKVEGILRDDSGGVESSETTLDYVAAGGHARGGLYFNRDPRRGKLELRVQGYREP